MAMYEVRVVETLTRKVPIEAGSEDEAKELVNVMYDKQEVVLTDSDHVGTEFVVEYECSTCGYHDESQEGFEFHLANEHGVSS